ncbi:P-loop containing nucleoside triphosphate hydrolase protein [Scheffersomyces xylosifermentans]|uniref:P-loop containing nucleoside triphosphate hydrolase protein n=1 Tax=Scheffersomyces xylosifermentans TaxID=1304137 RepID=UPI00315CB740
MFFKNAILVMCASAVATPLQTVMYGNIFTKLSDFYLGKYEGFDEFISEIRLLCGIIMIIGAGVFLWMQFGEKQQINARKILYLYIFGRSMEWFDTSQNVIGDVSQVNRCVEELRSGTSEVIGLLLQSGASIVALLITSLYHSWSLTLVIMGTAPIMAFFAWFFSRLTYTAATAENEINAKASKILDWTLSYGSIVRSFNGKYVEMAKFNKLVDKSAKAFFLLTKATAGNAATLRTFSLLMFVQGFWFGNYMVTIGKLRINEVFTCFTSCLMLGASISDLSTLLATLNKSQSAVHKIAKFMGAKLCDANNELGLYPSKCEGEIKFEGIEFSYPGRKELILKGLSLTIKKNELTFIIGKSGTGKSTLSSLLLRLYSQSEGSIYIDGTDISKVSHKWLTDNITVLSQTPVIFNDTIFNNIALVVANKYDSVDQVSTNIVNEAVDFAQLRDVIDNLKDGINSQIKSTTLSGGQNQRLAIARAKIRDTPILILDEALCAMDNRLRLGLFNSIRQWRKGKTTIVVVHETDHIKPYDNVERCNELYSQKENIGTASISPVTGENGPKRQSRACNYLTNPVILKDLEKTGCEAQKEEGEEKSPEDVMGGKLFITIGLIFALLGGAVNPVFSFCFSRLLSNMVDASTGVDIYSSLTFCGVTCFLSNEKWIRINEQDMSFFQSDSAKSAELTALLMNDSRDLRNLVSEFISLAIGLIVMLLLGVVWSIITGWKLALVGISFVPLILVITRKSENNYKTGIAELENHNYATIGSIKTIHMLDLNRHFQQEFETRLVKVKSNAIVRSIHTGFATGTILYYGMLLAGKYEYSQQQLLQVITILTFTMTNAASMLNQIPEISRGQRAGTLLIKLMQLEPSPAENNGDIKISRTAYSPMIKFNNLHFTYPGGDNGPVLKDVSFSINKGEVIGLVGKSGSGKSTVAALLTRLFPMNNRSIFLSNYDINAFDIDWLREEIAIVPQTANFFEGTIYENLLYGISPSKAISMERVERVLKQVNMYSYVVSLPEGVHSQMGEGFHSLLSGGQLQRLSIARALVREPEILILDECTSNLDQENTRSIVDLVKSLEDKLTVIIITHDTEVMKATSRLIVLKDGVVEEQGDYNSLYATKGELYKITEGHY